MPPTLETEEMRSGESPAWMVEMASAVVEVKDGKGGGTSSSLNNSGIETIRLKYVLSCGANVVLPSRRKRLERRDSLCNLRYEWRLARTHQRVNSTRLSLEFIIRTLTVRWRTHHHAKHQG